MADSAWVSAKQRQAQSFIMSIDSQATCQGDSSKLISTGVLAIIDA